MKTNKYEVNNQSIFHNFGGSNWMQKHTQANSYTSTTKFSLKYVFPGIEPGSLTHQNNTVTLSFNVKPILLFVLKN